MRGRFRFDPETGKTIPIHEWFAKYGPDGSKRSDLPAPNVIAPLQPYRSMIDGTMITDRAQHREHLREHGCIEVGNEPLAPPTPIEPDRAEIAGDIKKSIEQLRAGHKPEPDEVPQEGLAPENLRIYTPDP